jgi:hypothetical protein
MKFDYLLGYPIPGEIPQYLVKLHKPTPTFFAWLRHAGMISLPDAPLVA